MYSRFCLLAWLHGRWIAKTTLSESLRKLACYPLLRLGASSASWVSLNCSPFSIFISVVPFLSPLFVICFSCYKDGKRSFSNERVWSHRWVSQTTHTIRLGSSSHFTLLDILNTPQFCLVNCLFACLFAWLFVWLLWLCDFLFDYLLFSFAFVAWFPIRAMSHKSTRTSHYFPKDKMAKLARYPKTLLWFHAYSPHCFVFSIPLLHWPVGWLGHFSFFLPFALVNYKDGKQSNAVSHSLT